MINLLEVNELLKRLEYDPQRVDDKGVYVPTSTYITILEYTKDLIKTGVFQKVLDKREQKLLIDYITQDVTLQDLVDEAGVTTRSRVQQIISNGIKRTYRYLPSDIRAKYAEDEILKLKLPTAVSNRPVSLASKKQRGKELWNERNTDGALVKALQEARRQKRQERMQSIAQGIVPPQKDHLQ